MELQKIPDGLLIFIPGPAMPREIARLQAAYRRTKSGPDKKPGWILSQFVRDDTPDDYEWFTLGGFWVGKHKGFQETLPAETPAPPKQPRNAKPAAKKRRRRKPSRAIEQLYSILENEIVEQVRQFAESRSPERVVKSNVSQHAKHLQEQLSQEAI